MARLLGKKTLTIARLVPLILLSIPEISSQVWKPGARVFGFGNAAGAGVARLEPVADTLVSSTEKDKNFGSAATLRSYSEYNKILMRFDLGEIPAGAVVSSAKLYLTCRSVSAEYPIDPKRFYVYDLATDFVESEANYYQAARGRAWAGAGVAEFKDFNVLPYQSAAVKIKEPGRVSADLTDLVKLYRSAGRNSLSVGFFAREFNSSATIASREDADPEARPRLEIEFSTTMPVAIVEDVVAPVGPVRLDGTKSSLPNGSRGGLAFSWTVAKPAWGSTLAVNDKLGDARSLSFNPPQSGTYVLRLSVTNSSTGETGDALVRATIGFHDHPRLHLDDKLIAQMKSLRDSNDPVWARFYNWVQKKPTYSNIEGGIVTSYLLAYVITGQTQYVDWTWDLIKSKIYKNKVDRSGGFVPILELYAGNAHAAAYTGGPFTAQVAMLYDWGYQRLTPEQRQDLIQWMNDACSYNYIRNTNSKLYFRNDGAAVTYGLAAAAYATLGENPEAARLLSWFRGNWDELTRTLDIMGKGGALAEGNAYGTAPTAFNLIRAANLVYYATGEDLFASHPWFQRRLMYDAFATYPGTVGGPGSPVKWGWPGTIVEQASIGGDGRRGSSWHQVNLRPNGLMLARRFQTTEEAKAWNWVFRQPVVDRATNDSDCFYDLLYYSPKPPLEQPVKLSHFDPSMGYVYIRSDWVSPDATWIAFWAGPHLDTHQHLDQGAFTIFKRRDLAPKTGHLDRDDVSSPHSLAYYTRTISSNGLLVGDPNENFIGFIGGRGCNEKGVGEKLVAPDNVGSPCVPNDGGQRTMRPFGLASRDSDEFETYKDVFDVAKVLDYRENPGRSVAVVADLTNAYNNPRYSTPANSPKVRRVHRRLVYLREPDLLIVGDVVESVNPGFEKKWLLHSLDRIQVGGTAETVDAGEIVHTGVDEAKIIVDDTQPSDKNQVTFDMRQGYAALLLKTVFPKDFRYRRIGGRDPSETIHSDIYTPGNNTLNQNHFHTHVKDFWVKDYSEGVIVNHKSLNWMPESPNEAATAVYEPIFGPGYGRWRLEIEPAAGNQTDYFLNVLKPTVNQSASLPAIERIDEAGRFGAVISFEGKRYVVSFSRDSSTELPEIELPGQSATVQRYPARGRRE